MGCICMKYILFHSLIRMVAASGPDRFHCLAQGVPLQVEFYMMIERMEGGGQEC